MRAQDTNGTSPSDDGFPGGRVRLPRISRPHSKCHEEFIDQALYKEPAAPAEGAGGRDDVSSFSDSAFGKYYSSQSLFTPNPELDMNSDPVERPYLVLGLTRGASWEQIRRAHRSLVSRLHPDRYVGADEDVRADAERRVRDVNEAYSEIRRLRAGTSR